MSWWQFDLWRSLASVVVGLAIISPFLLTPTLRKRFIRSTLDIEHIGLLALVVIVIAIGTYNYLFSGSGA